MCDCNLKASTFCTQLLSAWHMSMLNNFFYVAMVIYENYETSMQQKFDRTENRHQTVINKIINCQT